MIQEIVTENLNRCPFCGGKAELRVTTHPFFDTEFMAKVSCQNCNCASQSFSTGDTMGFGKEVTRYVNLEEAKAKAAEAWNKRPGAETLETERENYIHSLPFSKVAALMKAATEAADLFKYASYEDSLFCERMMKLYGCVPLESDKNNLVTFLITLFCRGRCEDCQPEPWSCIHIRDTGHIYTSDRG